MTLDQQLYASRLLDWLFDRQVPVFRERDQRAEDEEAAAISFLKSINPNQSDEELLRLAQAQIASGSILDHQPDDRVNTQPFFFSLGVSAEDAAHIASFLDSNGLIEGRIPITELGGELLDGRYPDLKITSSGIEAVEKNRSRSHDAMPQDSSITQRLLIWMSTQNQAGDRRVYLANFLVSPYASFNGRLLFTPGQLETAATYLVKNSLLIVGDEAQHQPPVQVARLSNDGLECAIGFRGDVPRYLESRQRQAYNSNITITHASGVNVVSQSPAARQVVTSGADLRDIVSFADFVHQTAATLGLSSDQRTELEASARELSREAKTGSPDQGVLHRLAHKALLILRAATPSVAADVAIDLGEKAIHVLGA